MPVVVVVVVSVVVVVVLVLVLVVVTCSTCPEPNIILLTNWKANELTSQPQALDTCCMRRRLLLLLLLLLHHVPQCPYTVATQPICRYKAHGLRERFACSVVMHWSWKACTGSHWQLIVTHRPGQPRLQLRMVGSRTQRTLASRVSWWNQSLNPKTLNPKPFLHPDLGSRPLNPIFSTLEDENPSSLSHRK